MTSLRLLQIRTYQAHTHAPPEVNHLLIRPEVYPLLCLSPPAFSTKSFIIQLLGIKYNSACIRKYSTFQCKLFCLQLNCSNYKH